MDELQRRSRQTLQCHWGQKFIRCLDAEAGNVLPWLNKRKRGKRQGGETLPYPGSEGKASTECVGLPGFNLAEVGRTYTRTRAATALHHRQLLTCFISPGRAQPSEAEEWRSYQLFLSFLSLGRRCLPAYSLVLLPEDHQQVGCFWYIDMLGILCVIKRVPLSTAVKGLLKQAT